MKNIGKLWIIFSVIGIVATFLNPYIGLFGFVNFNEFGIMGILIIVAISRQKALEKYGENKLLKASVKIFGYIIYILSSIFFLIKLFAAVSLFIVAYSNNEIMAPYRIWSNPKQMGIIFLVIEMIFNVLLLIAFIYRGRSITNAKDRMFYQLAFILEKRPYLFNKYCIDLYSKGIDIDEYFGLLNKCDFEMIKDIYANGNLKITDAHLLYVKEA